MIRRLLIVAGVILTAGYVGAILAQDPPPPSGVRPRCVLARGHVRYANDGYDHSVELRNQCDRAAVCDVFSDVAPTPQHVRLVPSADTTLLLFRGSPARTFVPHVECTLERGPSRVGGGR